MRRQLGVVCGPACERTLPRLRTELRFCGNEEVAGVDVAFVCLPHGVSAPTVKRLLDGGARVVDLSADFRLPADLYEEWYGEHPFPELLPAVYGLAGAPSACDRRRSLVANPGCYPTAALLALEPLRGLGLIDVIVDAKSGVSGAGKAPSDATHFCTVDSDLVAYGLGGHRHYPEIATGIGAGAAGPSLTFVPHLGPWQRGIVETIYVRAQRRPRRTNCAPATSAPTRANRSSRSSRARRIFWTWSARTTAASSRRSTAVPGVSWSSR